MGVLWFILGLIVGVGLLFLLGGVYELGASSERKKKHVRYYKPDYRVGYTANYNMDDDDEGIDEPVDIQSAEVDDE